MIIAKFTVGMCILMNNYTYRIEEIQGGVKDNSYLLNQIIVFHESISEKKEYWRSSWVDTHSKQINCNKWESK